MGWPSIGRGESTLILAPTGTGKTLAAFLWCLNRLMFEPPRDGSRRCRVVYVSPLKALAVDVERNLRGPLVGITRVAEARGAPCRSPTIAVRTGDTPAAERLRFQRDPADILITTPESLYLLLTSNAREALRAVDTVIVDEIHALVPTKRGAHLALSLERLEARCAGRLQRIGLSATQRPLDEVARFLGGIESSVAVDSKISSADDTLSSEFGVPATPTYRPITVIDAGHKKSLSLRIEVPVEDMARLPSAEKAPRGSSSVGEARPSIWTAIHPRLLELIRAHRSTLIFVNSRRLAERLAGSLNELAGESLVRSHHGALARSQRVEVESLLKIGSLRALVATSSLELGIDVGAVDLVVQIEAPPSVASGLQRVGRGGHRVNAVSHGVIFPKFRGDLLAAAAVARSMREGAVEAIRYPRNPLDVVAQHVVAMSAMDRWPVDDLFATIRKASPFATLSRAAFGGVLDMLSGRYPSDEFAELRPRLTWDRRRNTVTAREGAKRVAIANGGTIPDRGLYGVFLVGAAPGASRVGELDEEMVFESRVGETFVLGASSWRIEEITHDRVLVSPAPGEPGKVPFWRGERAGRPLELGLAIGRLTHDLSRLPPAAAIDRLVRQHDLDTSAAENLLRYLIDQMTATRALPDASTVLIERVRDELGDWRVCVLSPRGGRIHAPWAMAVVAKVRQDGGVDVEMLWGDDGFVVRFPDVDEPPDPQQLLPDPDQVQDLVVRQLGATALFASKFRENAARSLLLPRRRPGRRTPLWQQRKRSADLLAVASRYGSFPMLLETYRECLRDYFDIPALVSTLSDIRNRRIRVVTVDSQAPSPFAASLLFSYVASFLYDGDAPLAERRAQALAVDQAQLRDLMGDAELRELLDAASFDEIERELQRLHPRARARHADGVHDLLLALGDLSRAEIGKRATPDAVVSAVDHLARAQRILSVRLAGAERYIAVEDAARYRDAVGVSLPPGLPEALLEPVVDPLRDLALRYARTHTPFSASDFATRYGLSEPAAQSVLVRLTSEGRLLEGEFRPGGTKREWTEPGVLRMLRRRSIAKLRHEVEPVEQKILARFTASWQGTTRPRAGIDALLDAIEQLQGAPLAASILETEILPARVAGYKSADLDAIAASGEVIWVGVDALGERDGRVALYLADQLSRLLPPETSRSLDLRETAVLEHLRSRGASFFGALHDAAGNGYPGDTVNALWNLAWMGLATNDTFQVLRAFTSSRRIRRRSRRAEPGPPFRSRRQVPPTAEGRWSLVRPLVGRPSLSRDELTRWAAAVSEQLLVRHGVLTRETVMAEAIPGGFSTVYPVLKAMEDAGRVRRGYFVAGLGATQFAQPGALDLLRSLREGPDPSGVAGPPEVAVLAATDPANPYGNALKWPGPTMMRGATFDPSTPSRGPTRSIGATVIMVGGALGAYLARGDHQLFTWLPEEGAARATIARAVAQALIVRARSGGDNPRGMLIEEIDGAPPSRHPMVPFLLEAGFAAGAMGLRPTFPQRESIEAIPVDA